MKNATTGGTIRLMADIEKLIDKFLTDKARITVDDCKRLLNFYNYVLRKGSGSHLTFHKKHGYPLTIVVPKRTKYIYLVYVNKIIKELGLEVKDDNIHKA